MVRVICPNCSHAYTPAASGASTCPRCQYTVGSAPAAVAARPVFSAPGAAPVAMAPPAPGPAAAPVGVPTNGMSVAALVLGIVAVPTFFMPLVALLALVFGIIGAVKTRNGAAKGLGMAITGIVLGALVLVGWAVFFYFVATYEGF